VNGTHRSELRRHAVLVRLADVELAAIKVAAGGRALGTWVRDAALRAARRHK